MSQQKTLSRTNVMQNPLFPTNQNPMPPTDSPVPAPSPVAPADNTSPATPGRDPAVDLIRQKIQNLYAGEPDVKAEMREIEHAPAPLSRHQLFMQGLQASGRNFAEIQQAWHEYYTELSTEDKYQVWQEFYAANTTQSGQPGSTGQSQAAPQAASVTQPAAGSGTQQGVQQPVSAPVQPAPAPNQQQSAGGARPVVMPALDLPQATAQPASAASQLPLSAKRPPRNRRSTRTAGETAKRLKQRLQQSPSATELKAKVMNTVSSGGKLQKSHHLQSLAFGLASGVVVVFIFLFSFFNEVIIAPFIQPSRQATNTPVIVDPASTVVDGPPKILIPKINVEIPLDYSITTTDEAAIERGLDRGIVHYPTTPRPGQAGNAAFFGHSSNNIFNPGKYKFAFVLLHRMETGDLFYLTDGGQTYAYRVFSKRIVQPTEVSVLDPIPGKTATATLITCDPPGTSINRLVVVGEQISPNPSGNTEPTPPPVETAVVTDSDLPGNGPTLWGRIWGSVF